MTVIPNGVDTTRRFNPACRSTGEFRRELGVGQDTAIVLFVGRIAEEKQPEHIAEVAERLCERKDIVFAVVGDGPEKRSFERLIAARGLTM